jgi:DNA-binding transcriptional MerR regulator
MQLNLPEKRYYKIGEVADAFGVNASLIRFWEKEFNSIKPKKNAKGDRRFTPEDVQQLKRIYELVKERGFTLEGAKTELSKSRNLYQTNDYIVSRLEQLKTKLIDLKNKLNRNAQ